MDRAGKSDNLNFNFEGKNCSIPDDWLYPLCKYKVEVGRQVSARAAGLNYGPTWLAFFLLPVAFKNLIK